jgi:hypothetical protein
MISSLSVVGLSGMPRSIASFNFFQVYPGVALFAFPVSLFLWTLLFIPELLKTITSSSAKAHL